MPQLATAANAATEHERTSGVAQRDTISKQLKYKLDHSHYDVDTQVQAQVANIQALADGRVRERDATIKARDDTIVRLERELEAAIKLSAKQVVLPERVAKDVVTPRWSDGTPIKPPEAAFNPELEPVSQASDAASNALLGVDDLPHDP